MYISEEIKRICDILFYVFNKQNYIYNFNLPLLNPVVQRKTLSVRLIYKGKTNFKWGATGPPQLLTTAIGRKTVDDRVSREGGVRGLPRFLQTRALSDDVRFIMPRELNYALK